MAGEKNAPQIVERIVLQTETREERELRERREKRDAERADALVGLVFPLRVRALQDGYPMTTAHHKPVQVKKGDVFTVGAPEHYSAKWMLPVPADTVDVVQKAVANAPKRPRRSGEDGNPDAPEWTKNKVTTPAAVETKGTSVI